MQLPSIHLNGTSREELSKLNNAVWTALNNARNAMGSAAPNARDYYVQGDEAYRIAAAEHRARCEKIEELMREYTAMAYHLAGVSHEGE